MIISLEDKLEKLYHDLKNMGYEVHWLSENVASDVIIYSGNETHIESLNVPKSSVSSGGVFLINGDNLNVSEILKIIKNRTYTSLF